MKKVKKIIVSFLLMCMLCVGMTCVASATAAEFRFSDPQTSVGEEVDVTAKVSSAKALNTIQATLSYDKTKLRFISGDDATGGDGTITISRNDENAGTTMEFNLKFQALDEGTTSVEVAKVDGIDSNGVALEITSGSSSVSIAEGDKSLIQKEDTSSAAGGTEVKIGKSKYIVTDDFSDTIIPDGFVRDALKFEGTDHQIIKQESSGALAMYLTPENGGDADFYLYDSDTGKFAPLEVIEVAKGRYIIPLADDGNISLPSQYQKTSLTLNGKEFDTWQDTKNAEYYIVYAMNSDGEKTTYRYDTTDGTYQKYSPSSGTSSASDSTVNNGKGIWGKILNFVDSFLDIVVIIALVLFAVLLIVVIITSVKLHYRDLELDDLYDEYGIDMDEEEAEKKIQKKAAKKVNKEKKKNKKTAKKPAAVKKTSRFDYGEDEFEDYEDDFDDEDPWVTENIAKAMEHKPAKKQSARQKEPARRTEPEREKKASKGVRALDETGPAIRKPVKKINLEDTNDFEAFTPLDEEAFDNFEGYYSEDDDYDLFGAGYDDDDLFDATADLLSNHPEKRRSHAEMDDTFKMDVIDLD